MNNLWQNIKDWMLSKVAPIQRYLKIGFGVLTILAMVAFAEKQYETKGINEVNIDVRTPFDHHFVKPSDVRYMIRDQYNTPLTDKSLDELDLSTMESNFQANPYVKNAEVYSDLEGLLTIQISQRNPILRVINQRNKSFYLDQEGQKMPTAYQYTAPVLTAKGHIQASAEELDSVRNETVKSLYTISKHIKRDSFLSALVGGIQVRPDQEFEIIPRVGDQTIVLGEAKALEDRFNKLKAFYRKVMPYKGWHQYESIHLKFDKQIVAKK